jgi:replicative DNA helicase
MNFEKFYAQLFDNEGQGQVLATGYKNLDQLLDGGFGAELIAVVGRPLHGKSTLLLNLMLNFSYFQEYKGILVSPLSNLPSMTKYLATIIQDTETGMEDWEEEMLLDSLSDIKSLFQNRVKVDFTFQNLEEVLTTAKAWKASYVIVDDFMSIMGYAYSPSYYHELLCRLKEFSQEAKIPIFISLLSRTSVERRGGPQEPMLLDLFRSELLCQQAHKVISVYQPMVIGLTEDDIGLSTKGKLEINLLKNSLGKSGAITLNLKESGRIGDG